MSTSPTVPTLAERLDDLVKRGVLFRYTLAAKAGMPERMLYCSDEMLTELEKLSTDTPPPLRDGLRLGGAAVPHYDQAQDRIEEFATGKNFEPHRLKRLNPLRNGVYEVKTTHLRLFGAFVGTDCFVFTSIGFKDDLEPKSSGASTDSYEAHINRALAFFSSAGMTVDVRDHHARFRQ